MQIVLEQAVIDLEDGKTLGPEEKGRVLEQLNKPAGKLIFAGILANINQPIRVSAQSLKTFGELVNCLLTHFVLEKDHSHGIMTVVLGVSKCIYAIVSP